MENLLNQKVFKNLAIVLVALLVLFTAVKVIYELKAIKYVGSGTPATNVISVSGKGEVLATPDMATFTFSVTQEASAVPEAQNKATDAMNAILAYLKKAGVEDKDVKTTSYNIYPRYEYHQTTDTPYYGGGKQVLAAYVVSQSIEIKVRNLDQAGTLLTGIGEFGATDISGLTFGVDEQTNIERQARDKAIADAREQAQILAKSLGVSLGRIVSFNEYTNNYPRPIYYAKDMAMGLGGAESVPSLPEGQNKITSNVSVVYEIR